MTINPENIKKIIFENENARILIEESFKLYPYMSLTIFDDEWAVTESFALSVWKAASGSDINRSIMQPS